MLKLKPFILFTLSFFFLISCAENSATNSDNGSNDYFSNNSGPILDPTNKITSSTSISSYSGNLYTALYYAPAFNSIPLKSDGRYNMASVPSQKVVLSASLSENSSSLYAPSFFSSLIDIEADRNFEEMLEAKRKADAVLRSALAITSKEDNFLMQARAMPLSAPTSEGGKWNNIYIYRAGPSNGSQETINATLKKVSTYAYFFVEDGVTVNANILNSIAQAFDKDYPTFVETFAAPGDTDNNGKVTFLIQRMNESVKSLMGYFFSADQLPADTKFNNGTKSNGSDVLYINSYYTLDDEWKNKSDSIIELFFHELQHMVLYHAKYSLKEGNSNAKNSFALNFPVWLNEGLSMLSGTVVGHTVSHKDYVSNFFFTNSHAPLINDGSYKIDYGYYLLFLDYLYARFGSNIIKKIYASSSLKDDEIIKEATGVSFEELFSDFVKMIISTGRDVTPDRRYNIAEFNHPEGSAGYNLMGFNLADELNKAISFHGNISYNGSSYSYPGAARDDSFLRSSGFTVNSFLPYSFYITKWASAVRTLGISNSLISACYLLSDSGF